MGLFAGKGQYKAAHHVHTTNSDGANPLFDVIEQHYALNYDILAITDHNFMTRHWVETSNGPDWTRFNQIASGSDRGNRPMLMIPYTVEQTGPWHIDFAPRIAPDECNTFLMDFLELPPDLEAYLGQLPNHDGIAHFNHIGRSVGHDGYANPAHVSRYADIFLRHPRLVGMEIVNRQDAEVNDRRFWDNLNARTMPQGRTVWGFSNDDTHHNNNTGYSFNVMAMPELTVGAFRQAMLDGSFYAVARVAHNEGVANHDRNSTTPIIADIEVTPSEIVINADNYHRIDWITEGSVTIHSGESLDVSRWRGGAFVRANVIGIGGVAFTQPFRVERTGGIEIHSPMRLMVAPTGPDDVVRLGDLGGTLWT